MIFFFLGGGGGYEDFVDIFFFFGGGGHQKLDWFKASFPCILGSFLKVNVQNYC